MELTNLLTKTLGAAALFAALTCPLTGCGGGGDSGGGILPSMSSGPSLPSVIHGQWVSDPVESSTQLDDQAMQIRAERTLTVNARSVTLRIKTQTQMSMTDDAGEEMSFGNTVPVTVTLRVQSQDGDTWHLRDDRYDPDGELSEDLYLYRLKVLGEDAVVLEEPLGSFEFTR